MEFEPDDHTHDESVPSARSQSLPPSDLTPNQPIPLRRLMIYPVILSISNYALLAVLGSATDALQSVFYATPIEYGGLGLPPSTIGRCLSAFGFFNGFLQAFFFAHFVRRWGPKRVFLFGIGTFVPVFALFPIINVLARHTGLSWIVWLFLAVQLVLCVAMNMCYSKSRRNHRFSVFDHILSNRLHVYLHYVVCAKLTLSWRREWPCTDCRCCRPCSRASDGDVTFWTIHPEKLARWICRLRRAYRASGLHIPRRSALARGHMGGHGDLTRLTSPRKNR